MVGIAMVVVLLCLVSGAIGLQKQLHSVADIIDELRTGDTGIKKKAAWALGANESRTAVSALVSALDDRHPDVRTLAAWALGEIKDEDAIPALVQTLNDGDLLVREMAVRALGEIGSPGITRDLLQMLDDSDPAIRATAVWSLGEIGTDRAFSAVEKSRQDHDVFVQGMAERVLLTADSQLEMQEELAARDPEIRNLVDSIRRETTNSDHIMLVARLGHDSPLVRSAAAYSLGRTKNIRGVDALIAAIRDQDPDVRAMVVWALDEINIH
jgi:HEAT repeat protein